MNANIEPDPEGHRREAHFHDEWAEKTEVSRIDVRAPFESVAAVENRFILRRMGSLRGKSVLDIGAGLGESSVYFALQGADVTISDVSPKMVAFAQALGSRHGVPIRGIVGAAETLDAPQEAFDFVYIGNLLHHVHDREAVFRRAHRALKPGGRFFSWDPLAYNPAIGVYRRLASEVRTAGERPLTFSDLEIARRYFPDVRHREFWIASLALFLKYYFVDRIDPNEVRYWKRIYSETRRSLWWLRPLQGLDAILGRTWGVRRLAWNIVMWGKKS